MAESPGGLLRGIQSGSISLRCVRPFLFFVSKIQSCSPRKAAEGSGKEIWRGSQSEILAS